MVDRDAGARYYLTTPIYYVNDAPHIGHAYTTVAADALARFMRLDGRAVHFLTGTDEHGQKVEKSAAVFSTTPQALADKNSENFRRLARTLAVTNDDFIRTTEPRHVAGAQALWRRLVERGEIYLDRYAGWYAVRDEAFYGEDELVDGKAPTGAEVEWVEEPSYFFRLSAWQDRLLQFYEANPDFIAPRSRRNEVVSFVKSGLRDLSVSRTSFKWGIPVPGDERHIMYVWLDALANYITALGYPDEGGLYRDFWPADLHLVGKDIVRFHAVYWPAFLMAADLPPPRRVFAHGWWTNEGQKISKSLGNVIDPFALIDRFGLDQTRYFLLREVAFGNDGDFSEAQMIRRINTDLANDFGNLAQRVLSQVARNCAGRIPDAARAEPADQVLLDAAYGLPERLRAEFAEQAFQRALEAVWEVVGAANRYIDEQAPWALKKTDPARMEAVLSCLVEVLRVLAIAAQPVVPDAAKRLLDQVGAAADARMLAHATRAHRPAAGGSLPAPLPLFPRYQIEERPA